MSLGGVNVDKLNNGTGTSVSEDGKIIDVCSPTKQQAGTSQAMEGFCASILFKRAKERKMEINNLVTDKCSAISPRLLHFFPNAEHRP